MTTSARVSGLIGDERPVSVVDDGALREIRRAILTAVAVPGYQVPFGSREMPVARGWRSGGLQVTLALAGSGDTVKVINQGDHEGVNAVNLRRLIVRSTGAAETTVPSEATIIQTRHRIPEDDLADGQILVLQVPVPEPLRGVERDMLELARMHAESDYSRLWVSLYEDNVRNGVITQTTGYPCIVDVAAADPPTRRRLRVDDLSIVHQNPADGLDLRITAGGNVAERLTAAELIDRTDVPLDASVAAGVLELIRSLLDDLGIAAVVVSHDFAVIEMLTQRCIVMHHGRVVESGLTDQLLEDPRHPYIQRLVAAARA